MILYHVRGHLYCEACILRCRTKAEKARAVVVDIDGLECHRCVRFGYPNLSEKAKQILRAMRPSSYRAGVIVNEHERTAYPFGGADRADYSRIGYGFTQADVRAALSELKAAGIQLSHDTVDAALHALHFGGEGKSA